MKIKTVTVLLFAFFLSFVINAQQDSIDNYKPVTEFDPVRDPFKDLKNSIDEAKRTNKRIILDVGGEWCIWCHRIDEFIENESEVKNRLNKNFIVLKINYSPENKNEKFLENYPEIPGYPHFFVLDKNGKLVNSQNTGDLEKGKGYDKEKFISFLKKWSEVKSKVKNQKSK